MMKYQMSSLEVKARQRESDINEIRNKDGNSLKDKAERDKKKYRDAMNMKQKNHNFSSNFSSFIVKENNDIRNILPVSNMGNSQENSVKKKILDKENVNLRADKGLPSLYICGELLKQKVHFIKLGDCLYYFNGRCYDVVSKNDIIRLYRDKVDAKLGNEKNLTSISQLHKLLLLDSQIEVVKSKNGKRISVLRNGIYDVMREKLFPHSHKEIVFSYIDADYVENEECIWFDRFLQDVTDGDENLQKRIWMFLGYTFMQTNEAKVFFVMGEAPDSGKSLLGNFIESLYSEQYVGNIALTDLNRNFALEPILGTAVNISLDLPASRLNTDAVSKLKMLTGGDALNINIKFEDEVPYRNRAKLIFASNFPINLIEPDDAFWNRLIYLPFTKSIPKAKQDRELAEKFQKEKNAIVSKALHYAKQLILYDFQFPTTPQIERKMQEWQGRSCATIENFITDCCICSEEIKGESTDTLYRAYENYCNATGYVAKNYNTFLKFLEEQTGMIHTKMRFGKKNPQSAFKGIKLLDDMKVREAL